MITRGTKSVSKKKTPYDARADLMTPARKVAKQRRRPPSLLTRRRPSSSKTMAKNAEINLGCNRHTVSSDEVWFLIVPPRPAEPFLEGRFQSEAIDRGERPGWVASKFCLFDEGEKATFRMPLGFIPSTGLPRPFLFISNGIWKRLVEEFAKPPQAGK